MSTSKHIDKICIAVVAITLVITILFMNGSSLGISIMTKSMNYESTLFDTSYVHTIDIVMNDWDTFIENCESEEYSACTVVIDGEKYSNIAIRAKGNTSLTTVSSLGSDRYSFKLEFDHYQDGKTSDGLDKLCLNNLIQDNTMMKDYIVYQMMNDFGVDSPLCSFAYLTVNGEDWGLYLAVEGIEDSFLSRNYGSAIGELYKPDSISNGGGRGNGKDFNMDDFDFGNGTDTDSTDTDSTGTDGGQSQESGIPSVPGQQNTDFPGNMTPPGQQNGNQQGMPGGQGGFNPGVQGGQSEQSGESSDTEQQPGGFDPSENGNGGGFTPGSDNQQGGGQQGGMQGGGMGSDDVKLKYIDDDPDSYSDIFNNAKTEISSADKARLIEALKNLSAYTDLENTVDIDEVIRYFVIHNFVCNGDSYTGSMIHNYYLYEEDGILSMIPWDYNLAFGTFQGSNASDTVNTSIDSPVSGGTVDDRPMLGWIFSDESYTEQYHALFSEFIEKWFTNGELAELIEKTADMIRPYVEKDPTKFCTSEEFDTGVTALSQFVTLRGEAVRRQLNGDTENVDTGSLNLSDMGTMNNGGGNGGGMNMPDIQNMNLLSFVTLTDSQGNSVDVTTVIPSTATVVGITLSDGTAVDLSSGNMQAFVGLDVGKVVSVTDSEGNVYDLSSYTVSSGIPTQPNGGNGKGGAAPSMPDGNGSTDNNGASSVPDGNGNTDTNGTQTSDGQSNAGGSPPSIPGTDTDGNSSTENQSGFPGGNGNDRQMPDGGGEGQITPGDQSGGADAVSDGTRWLFTGASALILVIGIFIAIKKKY